MRDFVHVFHTYPHARMRIAQTYRVMLNPSANAFVPSWASSRKRYTNQQLCSLRTHSLQTLKDAGWTAAGPFNRLPGPVADVIASCPRSFEFIDMDAAGAIMEGSKPKAVVVLPPTVVLDEDVRTEQLVLATRKRCNGYVLGPFLSQNGNVVRGLLQIEMAFKFKKTSVKMRQLGESPNIISIVREYLCGEGFHVQAPAVHNHEHWAMLMERLKFDWIRDNRTKIFTELSKFWKKSNTPFEQFVHFFFYRDSEPNHESKGMLTHRQKPIMVATLAGDVDAVVLLCDLGFYIPPDYFWELVGILGSSTNPQFQELRRVLVHFYRKLPPKADSINLSQNTILPASSATRVRDPKNPWQ